MLFIAVQFSEINSISVFLNDEFFDINEFEYFTFWMVTVCNPIDAFLVEIVSDWMDHFPLAVVLVLLHG